MDIRIRDIDLELHRQFKILCVRDGITIDNKVKELIGDYVNAEKAKETKGKK